MTRFKDSPLNLDVVILARPDADAGSDGQVGRSGPRLAKERVSSI